MPDDIQQLNDINQDALESGQETPELQSGDDIASQALASVAGSQSNESDETAESDQLALTITSLQNIIERNADNLDTIKQKLKLNREQLKSIFENDTQLSEATQQADTFTKQIRERKSSLQSDPEVTKLKVEVGELSEQKKEIEEALSSHLVNFYQLTNSTSFDTSDGDQREFVIKAAVKSKRK